MTLEPPAGIIIELLEDDTNNGSIYPIVVFPTENGAEVPIIAPIHY
jgi:hypothetical protein